MANPSRWRRSAQRERQPLLRHIPPIPIDDDDDDDDNDNDDTTNHPQDPRDSDEYCTHLGERLQRSAAFPTKLAATLVSFLVLGLLFSTPGVVLPQLEAHYHLNDAQVSWIFLVAPAGYLVGAWANDRVHRWRGQRGIAVLAPLFQATFAVLAATVHPRPRHGAGDGGGGGGGTGFPVFLLATAIGNIGNGLLDGSWCAWAGGLGSGSGSGNVRTGSERRTNTVQGLLHGSFSIGAGLGPFLAETMFSVGHTPWWTWYWVLLGAILVQLVVLAVAFRYEDAARYRADMARLSRGGAYGGAYGGEARRPVAARQQHARTMFRYGATWVCAAYFLVYVGTEAAIAGWVITFMQRARRATPYLASFASSGFYAGMAAGRLVLGLVTDRWFLGSDVRRATAAYLTLAILAQALLATVDVAAVAIALVVLLGFLLGPLFPSGVVMLAQLLPRPLLVGAVSFTAAVGQVGAAVAPFALGALAQALGIYIFQVFILAMLAVTLLVWVLFPASPPPPPPPPLPAFASASASSTTVLQAQP